MFKYIMKKIFLFIFIITSSILPQDAGLFKIGRLKYSGGGDWYNDPSAEVNLLNFIASNTNIKVKAEYKPVDITSGEIFSFPFLFLTGHGNITLSDDEVIQLRNYLESGGFLFIDDDYGLDEAIRREMKKVFPGKEFIEIPYNHKIYNIMYDFSSGPPKTHKHNENPAQGFGIFVGDHLAVYYSYETNPSDGWADQDVHNDPEEKRIEALKFGTNIILYALSF